ncbi:hypothetical protein AO275_00615 [Pseudomonas viridiflava]|nr:hypothetical protein AO275_00615 [Pseudomonas viridiflava]
MKSRSLIYEAVVQEVKQEIYIEGLMYGIVDDLIKDGDRMTTHRLRKSWLESDGIGAIDSQGNEFLIIDLAETNPLVMDSVHVLFALAYLTNGSAADA